MYRLLSLYNRAEPILTNPDQTRPDQIKSNRVFCKNSSFEMVCFQRIYPKNGGNEVWLQNERHSQRLPQFKSNGFRLWFDLFWKQLTATPIIIGNSQKHISDNITHNVRIFESFFCCDRHMEFNCSVPVFRCEPARLYLFRFCAFPHHPINVNKVSNYRND